MEVVNTEIDNIIQLGRTWGMTDEDISECLLKGSEQSGKKTTEKIQEPPSSSLWTLCCWAFFFMKWTFYLIVGSLILLTMLSTILSVIMTTSPELDMKIQAFVNPYIFPTMRLARLLLKPIADYFRLEGYYSAECMVYNPFYAEEVPDCQPCQGIQEFAIPNPDDPDSIPQLISDLTPFYFEDFGAPVQFSSIQQAYLSNTERFFPPMSMMATNVLSTPNLTEVMSMTADDLVKAVDGSGQTVWKTGGVGAAQVIRKLFPRPYFLPPEAEVSLGKTILISGPNAAPYEMGQESFALIWYYQASGSNKVTLFPHPGCKSDCHVIEHLLHAGDLVFMQDQFWRLSVSSSMVKEDSDQLRIGFLSSFTF